MTDTEFRRIVGSNIKRLRKEAGLTQVDLANLVGTSQPRIVIYEQGGEIELTTLFRLANALDVTVSDLVKVNRPKSR